MILVTGVTGFIGSRLARRLVERGFAVRGLALPGDPADAVGGLPVDLVRGDVTDPDSLRGHGTGVTAIVHAAALMLPNTADAIRRVNVDGTANVIDLARSAGIRRLVYLSAVSAVYARKNAYGRSKQDAERLVADSGLGFTILRPTMVYGPGGGLHFQRLVGLVDRLPFVVPVPGPGTARLQPVFIDDVVSAIEGALGEPRAIGRTYDVSGASVVTFDELVDAILKARGRRRVKVHAPLGLCLAAARALSLFPGPSFLSTDALLALNEDATLDHAQTMRDLGWKPLTLAEGLDRVFCYPRALDGSNIRSTD